MSPPKVTRVKSGKRNAGIRVLQGRRIEGAGISVSDSVSETESDSVFKCHALSRHTSIESGSGSTTGTATDSDLVSLERLEPVPLNIVNAVNSPSTSFSEPTTAVTDGSDDHDDDTPHLNQAKPKNKRRRKSFNSVNIFLFTITRWPVAPPWRYIIIIIIIIVIIISILFMPEY